MVNGEFKTVSATPLNEQQYLPTLKNLMSFKSELLGMSVKLFRFSKLPFKEDYRIYVRIFIEICRHTNMYSVIMS